MSQAVEVELPYNSIYVSGTVNDVAVTWTNVTGNTWQAEADRADNGVYVIDLYITNDEGITSDHSLVLFYGGLNLITDRSAADVERWKELRDKGFSAMSEEERAEWLSPMKGCYGVSDMNRVEGAVMLIASRFNELGYLLYPETKTNWTKRDIPSWADMERYFDNVRLLREKLPLPLETPSVPAVGDRLDYITANNLEKILLEASRINDSIKTSWYQAGEINSGEV